MTYPSQATWTVRNRHSEFVGTFTASTEADAVAQAERMDRNGPNWMVLTQAPYSATSRKHSLPRRAASA